MSLGFILEKDPDTTVYRNRLVANQTSAASLIQPGQLFDVNRGSATIEIAASSASSVTSAIYGVSVSTQTLYDSTKTFHPDTDKNILIALISPRQTWSADTTNAANAAHNNLRAIIGANNTLVNNTGSDVTGTTGVFQQEGVLTSFGTNRIIGRFLTEHAA
jgi:hypothetical protein